MQNQNILLALSRIENKQSQFEIETDKRFEEVFKKIKQYDLPKQLLFFDGQFYDSFEFISSIIAKAKIDIILIDSYFDAYGFSFLKSKNSGVRLTIYRDFDSKDITEELIKFEKQYGKVEMINCDKFHNRYLIIDGVVGYSLGTSLNRMGTKIFDINKLEDCLLIQIIETLSKLIQ